MMLVKGTVMQSASMPGTHARCTMLLPLPRVCPGMGRLAFTSGSTDPKFIACRVHVPNYLPDGLSHSRTVTAGLCRNHSFSPSIPEACPCREESGL